VTVEPPVTPATEIDRERFPMRAPCPSCAGTIGYLTEVNGQDTVRCRECNRHCYNAPRTETGRAVRSVTTVHKQIKPSLRAKILQRDNHRCVLCHSINVPLHVGHIVSVEGGLLIGLTDAEINDEENLIAQCEECNLGQGSQPLPLRTAIAVLRARIAWREKHGADE